MTDDHGSSKGNILIVNSNHDAAMLFSIMLTREGYSTVVAIGGNAGLAAARETPPDLILVDLMMADMDGYQVCRQLQQDEQLQDIPAIVTSAADRPNHLQAAVDAGAVDFIALPTHPAEIL